MFFSFDQDATDEINAYHPESVLKNKLPLFYFGDVNEKIDGEFRSLNPPIYFHHHSNDVNNNRLLTDEMLLDENSFEENLSIVRAYRRLHEKLHFLGNRLFTFVFVFIRSHQSFSLSLRSFRM